MEDKTKSRCFGMSYFSSHDFFYVDICDDVDDDDDGCDEFDAIEKEVKHFNKREHMRSQASQKYLPTFKSVIVVVLFFVIYEVNVNIPWTYATAASAGGTKDATQPTKTCTTNSLPRSTISPARNTHWRGSRSSLSETDEESSSVSSSSSYSSKRLLHPPWNPSPYIDSHGFLKGLYRRLPGDWEKECFGTAAGQQFLFRSKHGNCNLDAPAKIRQVPGDGNCLFHSISMCLYHAVNRTHWDISSSSSAGVNQQQYEDLYFHSQQLRHAAVECLARSIAPSSSFLFANQHRHRNSKRYNYHNNNRNSNNNNLLYLQGREYLEASELVHAAAQQYGLTPREYCESMIQESVWGGGPEIVALSNVLKRPIHVYELTTTTANTTTTKQQLTSSQQQQQQVSVFALRRMACFGSPKFDRNKALHILSADSRFPDIQPGQQLSAGNHFLAVFPCQEDDDEDYIRIGDKSNHGKNENTNRSRKQRVRGGFATRFGMKNYQSNYSCARNETTTNPIIHWLSHILMHVLGISKMD